eukprot:scaffold1917_cov196-Alexandrium_tamarense.AAC.12
MRILLVNMMLFLSICGDASSTPWSATLSTQHHDRALQRRTDASIINISSVDLIHGHQSKEVSFLPVVYVAIINAVVNSLRPEPSISWQARVPRVLWEVCIACVAIHVSTSNPPQCLVLSLMTISTAFIDIFVWDPMFAFLATFETCSGGGIFSRQPRVCTSDYMKGIGRLFVSVQSMATGVFYLVTAVVSWSAFADSRDSKQWPLFHQRSPTVLVLANVGCCWAKTTRQILI